MQLTTNSESNGFTVENGLSQTLINSICNQTSQSTVLNWTSLSHSKKETKSLKKGGYREILTDWKGRIRWENVRPHSFLIEAFHVQAYHNLVFSFQSFPFLFALAVHGESKRDNRFSSTKRLATFWKEEPIISCGESKQDFLRRNKWNLCPCPSCLISISSDYYF